MNKNLIITALLAVFSAGAVMSTVKAAAPDAPQGRITVREYHVGGPNAISRLTNHAGYPDSPDETFYPIHFEWPTGPTGNDEDSAERPPGNVRDNYATEIRGYYYPGYTGDHFFAIAADDPGELWLSTDDSFDNLELIANEPTWNPVRAFGGADRRALVDEGTDDERLQNWSKGIRLEEGKPYAIMARAVEGGGGDNLAVAHNNEMFFENDMEPIPGSFLSTFDRASFASTSVKRTSLSADSVSVTLKDGEGNGAVNVDPDSVSITIGGQAVDVSTSKDGDLTVASGKLSSFLGSLSTHNVVVNWKDSGGADNTAEASLTVPGYTTVSGDHKIANVDTSTKGFLMRVVQSEYGLANNTAVRERHLAGELTDPDGEPLFNEADDLGSEDFVWTVELINMDQDGADQGEFRAGAAGAQDRVDDFIPGIPGFATADTDNITAEIHTVIRIPEAGLVTFGFNSDDGFETSAGNLKDIQDKLILGGFNGGRGASTTSYTVLFEEPGDYQLRSIWYEGGGGANLEWFTQSPVKALLNDTDNGGFETFAVKTDSPLALTSVDPAPGTGGLSETPTITFTLEDGSTTLDKGSVAMTFNGQSVSADVSSNGGVHTISYTVGTALGMNTKHTAAVSFKDNNGKERSVNTNFATLRDDVLVYWDFNDNSDPENSADVLNGVVANFVGGAAFSADGEGASGKAGDRALWLGDETDAGSERAEVDASQFFNLAAGQDQMTVAFWQKWATEEVFNQSSFWFVSPSTGSGNRGAQAHTPWSNGNIYFDTAGCCDGGTQRINAAADVLWEEWTHFAFVKNGAAKEIYINGELFLDGQNTGKLPTDHTLLTIGSAGDGGNSHRGWMDDFVVFSSALPQSDIASLMSGTHPSEIRPVATDVPAGGAGGGDGGAIEGISIEGNQITITYTGTLQSSDTVNGDYSAVAGASSPFTTSADGAAKFYIAR